MILDLIGIILFYVVWLDMIMAYLTAKHNQREENYFIVQGKQCYKCGGIIEHPVFSIFMIKYLTHRCEDNLT